MDIDRPKSRVTFKGYLIPSRPKSRVNFHSSPRFRPIPRLPTLCVPLVCLFVFSCPVASLYSLHIFPSGYVRLHFYHHYVSVRLMLSNYVLPLHMRVLCTQDRVPPGRYGDRVCGGGGDVQEFARMSVPFPRPRPPLPSGLQLPELSPVPPPPRLVRLLRPLMRWNAFCAHTKTCMKSI